VTTNIEFTRYCGNGEFDQAFTKPSSVMVLGIHLGGTLNSCEDGLIAVVIIQKTGKSTPMLQMPRIR